ncbi:diaminopimelate decarboxylase [Actinocorallia herbida]|uniref:Diaminopimelate decarboxylase n=1 Tax=Actinocorallia herbida TaxID=58109 RepID=A0A3N1DCI8_9ACTN|nr:diaminopimelate decarboxylase [Actinocorallia herbida]ROO91219.1 diaminopimelate decarboxylase [Actinocorallia herbida]
MKTEQAVPETGRLEAGVWPLRARLAADGELEIGGVRATDLARRFGTPLHVLDEADVRERCRAFRAAFPGGEVAYASKAMSCTGLLRWVREEGLSLDASSAGELAVARRSGFPADRILLHGNGKTGEDLRAAFSYAVGTIVVDSAAEISRLAVQAASGLRGPQAVLLRVVPGIDGGTHAALTTGTEDQQFGFSLASGAAAEAAHRILGQHRLRLAGVHCHIGSQIADLGRYVRALDRVMDFLVRLRATDGVVLDRLDLGGGFAVPYRAGDPGLEPADVGAAVQAALTTLCARHRYPTPRLTIEPGRAIVARAGVTLYRVVGVKRAASGRVFVTVDGGMSDNPRPSLYQARYTVRLAGRTTTANNRPVTIVGRHCEAGDVLVPDASLPADLRLGEVLAVACTGAYHHAMASNYNLVRRSPVVAVRGGRARLLVRRETEDDLLARDVG